MPRSIPQPVPGDRASGINRSALYRRLVGHVTEIGIGIVVGIALIVIWDWSVFHFNVSPAIFPRPGAVWTALVANIVDGTFVRDLWITLVEVAIGFVGGSLAGFLLALAMSESRLARMVLYPYIVGFQTIPKVALAPMFLIWFGFGLESKISLVISGVLFPVLVNTMAGLERTNPDQLEMMRAYCGRRWRVFLRVKLPNSLPLVFAGLELAIILSLIMAVVSEYLGALGGLGYRILTFNINLDMAGQFAAILVLSVTGYVLYLIVHLIGQRVVFWGRAKEGSSAQ